MILFFYQLSDLKQIYLISDTHSYLGDDVIEHLHDADEIWHAGDIGNLKIIDTLKSIGKPLRVVYGNIDDKEIQIETQRDEIFECEGLKVYMTHIGGYPGRYTKRVYADLHKEQPGLYICGHSHILKVMADKKLDLLHMNPGACGVIGFHKFRTILKFKIISGKVEELAAIELGLRGIAQS